jgi:hypothetical protein
MLVLSLWHNQHRHSFLVRLLRFKHNLPRPLTPRGRYLLCKQGKLQDHIQYRSSRSNFLWLVLLEPFFSSVLI